MLDALSRICDEKELQLRWPQTDIQRAQHKANLPRSYLPADGNGAPMSHVERHRAIMAGRRTGGHQQPRGRPQESGIWAKGTGFEIDVQAHRALDSAQQQRRAVAPRAQ